MPRSAEALALRAACYSDLNQPESAKTDLEAAIDLSPHDGKLHYELANVLCKLGDYDDAIKTYQAALACNRQDLRDTLHYHLGLAYHKSGNPEKALAEFRTAKALGWPPEQCDAQIVACQPRGAPPVTTFAAHKHSFQSQQAEHDSRQAEHDQHETTVYVTTTGKKYHHVGCHHLRRSKISMSLNQAGALYEPCTHCRPPTVNDSDSDATNVAVSQLRSPGD